LHGGKKLVIAWVVAVILAAAFSYLNLAMPDWSGDLERFVRSKDVKAEVTIIVVGVSAFVAGFGLRDVIGRWRGRALRTRP